MRQTTCLSLSLIRSLMAEQPSTVSLPRQIELVIAARLPISRPTPERPSYYNVALDAEMQPYACAPVHLVTLDEIVGERSVQVTVACATRIPSAYRRHVWMHGEPLPDLITGLGLEVLA